MLARHCSAALALVFWACSAASAVIVTTLVPVPIAPEAVAADPALANMQTWDLRIEVPPGLTWGYCGVDATLTQGRFYNSPLGADWPVPQLWPIFPQLRHDTFLTQAADPDDDGTFAAPNVTSGFPDPPEPIIFTDQRISAVWHHAFGPGVGPGVYTVARLTVSNDAVGSIVGHTFPRTGGNVGFTFAFPVPIPEPGTALATLGFLLLSLRRMRLSRRCESRPCLAVVAPLVACMLVFTPPTRVSASIATFLAPLSISPEAVAADPALANMQTWDLRIEVPPGLNWGYTGLLATLTQGQFYNSPFGANWPTPQLWGVFPQLRFDTFVTDAADPEDDSTFRAPHWHGGYPEYPAPIEFTDTKVSVVYLANFGVFTGPGIFTIGRLTFSNDAIGTIIGFTADRGGFAPIQQWSFPIPVPEPVGTTAIIGLVAFISSRRFRRSARDSAAACAAGLAVFVACGSSAHASITTFMAPVPISPQAIAADPALANMQTWDIRVIVPAGHSWGYTGTLTTLTAGQFYNSPLGANWPVPQLWGVFPQLRYDTFISMAANPDDDSTFGQPDNNPGAWPGVGQPSIFDDTTVSAVWGPGSISSGPGTFTVARLTFSNDAVGSIEGISSARTPTLPFPPPVGFGFPIPIPEPSAGLLVGALGLAMLRRTRARTFCVAGIICAGLVTVAHAVPVTTFVQVPISPHAIAADPALANYESWDLRVSVGPGEVWNNTAFDIILSSGNFYNSPFGSTSPLPHAWGVLPQLRFDTFVTQAAIPEIDASFISPMYYSGFPGLPNPIIFDDTRISIVYAFTPENHASNGTFTLARLTLSNDAVGYIEGYQVSSLDFSTFSFPVVIPEPAAASAIVWGCFLLRRRPKRRALK